MTAPQETQNDIDFWNVDPAEYTRSLKNARFSSDGQWVAIAMMNKIEIYEANTLTLKYDINIESKFHSYFNWLEDDTTLAVISDRNYQRITLPEGEVLNEQSEIVEHHNTQPIRNH